MRLALAAGTFIVCLGLAGCSSSPATTDGPKYFPSPAEAVERITVMLEEKNWVELAHYYDLSDSPEERATLTSGEFFYTDQEPAMAHPAGFWHYRHPFAPGFPFHSRRDLEAPDVIEVTVMVEIDQGGGMVQRGTERFLMRQTDNGYQVMPHKAPAF